VWDTVPPAAQALLTRMLHPDPEQRIALEEVLTHEWIDPVDLRTWCPDASSSVEELGRSLSSTEEEERLRAGLKEGESIVEMWQNQRYRLQGLSWGQPYSRGGWTSVEGAIVYSNLPGEAVPSTFRLPAEGSLRPERTASCGGLVCSGATTEGQLVEVLPEQWHCAQWEYSTGWRQHGWGHRASWRSFVRRRRWVVVVRPCEEALSDWVELDSELEAVESKGPPGVSQPQEVTMVERIQSASSLVVSSDVVPDIQCQDVVLPNQASP